MSELHAGGMDIDKNTLDETLYEHILKCVLEELSIRHQDLDDFKAEIFELL